MKRESGFRGFSSITLCFAWLGIILLGVLATLSSAHATSIDESATAAPKAPATKEDVQELPPEITALPGEPLAPHSRGRTYLRLLAFYNAAPRMEKIVAKICAQAEKDSLPPEDMARVYHSWGRTNVLLMHSAPSSQNELRTEAILAYVKCLGLVLTQITLDEKPMPLPSVDVYATVMNSKTNAEATLDKCLKGLRMQAEAELQNSLVQARDEAIRDLKSLCKDTEPATFKNQLNAFVKDPQNSAKIHALVYL